MGITMQAITMVIKKKNVLRTFLPKIWGNGKRIISFEAFLWFNNYFNFRFKQIFQEAGEGSKGER